MCKRDITVFCLLFCYNYNCFILSLLLILNKLMGCRDISQLSSVDEERLHGSLDST